MQLFSMPGNELPRGLLPVELATPDKVKLRAAYATASQAPKGTVCIFPGRSEFIERYFEVIKDLQRRGYAVAILDWRGQGGSQRPLSNPLKGHVTSFKKFDLDLMTFMNDLVLPDCPPPYRALAHSMGAQVLMRSLHKKPWFERVVLSAPMLRLSPKGIPMPVLRWLTTLLVGMGLGRGFVPFHRGVYLLEDDFEHNVLTSDKRRYLRDCRTLADAPSLRLGGPTIGWLRAALASMDQVMSAAKRVELLAPVLIIGAGADQVVSVKAIRKFAERSGDIAAVFIADARHEPLQERDPLREQFWAAFDSFMG